MREKIANKAVAKTPSSAPRCEADIFYGVKPLYSIPPMIIQILTSRLQLICGLVVTVVFVMKYNDVSLCCCFLS